ncbi:hypothetical protein HK100_011865 [Physocladia obscura]|uniref:ATP-dependent DNA ligase family profile domain-containing protein n=1 Tax=Physocladia obscura TaxID=109957 RepID=A0AAD5T0M2_9FUNG|nr:hypothetical protein HK100_011865 [Physocladia obscura]
MVSFESLAMIVAKANVEYKNAWKSGGQTAREKAGRGRAVELIRNVIKESLRTNNNYNDIFTLARLLAPALERERVFGLKVKGLRRALLASDALGTAVSPTAANILRTNNNTGNDSDTAQFADAIYNCVSLVPSKQLDSRTITQTDELLHELSTFSGFSVDNVGTPLLPSTRSLQKVLFDLFNNTAPETARFLAKVILKIPTTLFHESWSLSLIHPLFWQMYNVQPNLHAVCQTIKEGSAGIQIGVNVANMALSKGTSCAHVIRHMYTLGESEFTAEVKYDGERSQIHFNNAANAKSQITLYSKSKRNSTNDRILCHEIIFATLGHNSQFSSKLIHGSDIDYICVESAIFDSELLVYNEDAKSVEPFYEVRNFATEKGRNNVSIASGRKHYMIVFFDILLLNGEALIQLPYLERRNILSRVIRPIKNYSKISEAKHFDLRQYPNDEIVCNELRMHFLQVCARPAEGLVCKGIFGQYLPGKDSLWLKLKKDYIEGFGDTVDFAVIGGGYRHDLTDYLGITRKDDEALLNCFVVGCQTNREIEQSVPKFLKVFEFSAGFSRESLLYFSQSTIPIRHSTMTNLSYSVTGSVNSNHKIEYYFDPPVAVELKGGGLECRNGKWALRGPRYLRTCTSDRGWQDTVSYSDFAIMGRKANESSDWKIEDKKLAVVDAKVSAKLLPRKKSLLSRSLSLSAVSDECPAEKKYRRQSSDIFSEWFSNLTNNSRKSSQNVTQIIGENCFDIAYTVQWKHRPLHTVGIHEIEDAFIYIPAACYTEAQVKAFLKTIFKTSIEDLRSRILFSLDAILVCTGWAEEDGRQIGNRSGIILVHDNNEEKILVETLEKQCQVGSYCSPKVLIVVCAQIFS